MNRRTFVTAAGGLLAAFSPGRGHVANKTARVAALLQTTPEGSKHLIAAFASRLSELGWVEGKSIEYIRRYAGGDGSKHASHVAEVLKQKPDAILAPFGPFALAAKKQTQDVPIVFAIVDDPVAMGLVASLARPGGNATGVTTRGRDLSGKQLQLLRELVPSVRRVGVVTGGTHAEGFAAVKELTRASAQIGLEVVTADINVLGDPNREIERGLEGLTRQRADAVIGLTYVIYPYHREFVEQVRRTRLPGLYDGEEFVQAGGLMSLSVSFAGRYREAANYVDKILRGAKPADLPVEEPLRFVFAVNKQAAHALGLTIPPSLLVRADRVIE